MSIEIKSVVEFFEASSLREGNKQWLVLPMLMLEALLPSRALCVGMLQHDSSLPRVGIQHAQKFWIL